MTTRPTTDGDTAEVRASLMLLDGRTIDAWESHEAWLNGLDALDLITTRIPEQEVELERLRGAVQEMNDAVTFHNEDVESWLPALHALFALSITGREG